MVLTIHLVFLVVAAILALLAAFNVGTPRVSLGWLAVACIALGLIF